MLSPDEVYTLFRLVLDRKPAATEVDRFYANTKSSELYALNTILASAEYIGRALSHAPDLHGLLLHGARCRLVATMLPPADAILDIGGANGNLRSMGYPYPFKRLTVVDLPPDDRHEMYRRIRMQDQVLPHGTVETLYANATQLDAVADASIDLVWMGQVIEHISEEDSFKVYAHVRRILKPKGCFCVDTPNRDLTEIHTDGWIHSEHKIEYRPPHLQRNLRQAGFTIVEQLGLCQMIQSWRTKRFHYADFVSGAGLSGCVEGCYIQYYRCRIT